MPFYSYTSEDGSETTRKLFRMGKAPKRIRVGLRTFYRDIAAEWSNRRSSTTATWPQVSISNAVHPSQVKKAMEIDRRLGVPIDYDGRGRAIFSSRGQKQDWLKAHRRVDHDAGYGDPAPGGYSGSE